MENYYFGIAKDIILFVDEFYADLNKIALSFDCNEPEGNLFYLDLINKENN